MNKQELIIAMQAKTKMSKKDTEAALNAFMESVKEGLTTGENKVKLVGFGTFEVRKRQAKIGRNPATGEEMNIPEMNVVVFKSSSELKDLVNE